MLPHDPPLTTATEHVLLVTNAHWVRYVPSTIISMFLLLMGIFFLSLTSTIVLLPGAATTIYILGAALILLAYHKFFHMYFSERMRTIIITDKRVIYLHTRLYMAAHEHEIPLRRIHDVSVERIGFITYLLNCGFICFEAPIGPEESVKRCIPFVPHPDRVGELIVGLLPAATDRAIMSGE